MHFDEMYPGRFVKAADFRGLDVTYTVKAVQLDKLEGNKGVQTKGILSFHETEKQLALNKTNGLCIKSMFGAQTDAWVGKRVTFYPANIQFEDTDIAVRVRGSPDIAAQITFELKLPRKKPKTTVLQKTGGTPTARPPTIFERITVMASEYGVPRDEVGALLKSVLGKANAKELVESDLGLLRAHFEKSPEEGGDPSPPQNEPEGDIPF